MKKYILAVMIVLVISPITIARSSNCADAQIQSYEQKPHLEIKCPCGARFVTYEWLNESLLVGADKFMEKHPCAHNDNKETGTYYPVVEHRIIGLAGTTTVFTNINDTGIEKLIGKMVHRTKPCGITNDKSYITEPRKLLDVTDEYLILSSDILAEGKFKIERNEWDDGNWEEWIDTNTCDLKIGDKVRTTSEYNKNFSSMEVIGKIIDIAVWQDNKVAILDNGKKLDTDWLEKYDTKQKLIIVNESNETIYLMVMEKANYYCVRCRKLLYRNPSSLEYYCNYCKAKWDIEKK